MATERQHSAKPTPPPTIEPAGCDALGMRAQYRVHAHLGRKLQDEYQPVVEEPVPQTLVKLLAGLKRKQEES
jgi:hypothetical protein